MSATCFSAAACGAAPSSGDSHVCGLCGATEPGKPSAMVLRTTFTDWSDLIGDHVCWGCEFSMGQRSHGYKLRSHHLATNGEFRYLERREIWGTILCPPPPPFVIYPTLSGQKHGLYRAKVAESVDRFWLQAENRGGWLGREHKDMMREALVLRKGGVSTNGIFGTPGSNDWHVGLGLGLREFKREHRASLAGDVPVILAGTIPGIKDIA